MPDFVRVGSAGDFEDGRLYDFKVDGKSVVVVRCGTRFYAFRNACTHWGYLLTPGSLLADGSIYCPVHGAAFNLAGEPIAGPADDPLDAYSVRVEGDDVFVSQNRP
jgi:3-phenylpropionate/trans-cinnamate dioxygenase ferredoxin subunit